jgi:TPR repeat protein
MQWYIGSIKKGNVDAMKAVGWMHLLGEGIIMDRHKAIQFFQQAAEKKDLGSAHVLQLVGQHSSSSEMELGSAVEQCSQEGAEDRMNDVGCTYRFERSYEEARQ